MSISTTSKEQIIGALGELPPESLREVQHFLDFLRFKNQARALGLTIALGGLLEGYRLTEEDIAQVRHETWGRVKESVLSRLRQRLDLPTNEQPPSAKQVRATFARYQQCGPLKRKLLSQMVVEMREE